MASFSLYQESRWIWPRGDYSTNWWDQSRGVNVNKRDCIFHFALFCFHKEETSLLANTFSCYTCNTKGHYQLLNCLVQGPTVVGFSELPDPRLCQLTKGNASLAKANRGSFLWLKLLASQGNESAHLAGVGGMCVRVCVWMDSCILSLFKHATD